MQTPFKKMLTILDFGAELNQCFFIFPEYWEIA